MQIRNDTNKELSLYHDYIFWLTGSRDSSTTPFPFVDFIASANFALDYVVRKMFKATGRWQYADSNNTNLSIATTDLVANQDNYTIADEQLRVARVRMFDEQGNFKTLIPKDRRDLSDDELKATGEPKYYDKMGRSILPFPIPDYSGTGGVEIEVERGSNHFDTDDTTKEPGIPNPFHRYISLLPARDKVLASTIPNKLQAIDTEIQRLDDDLIEFMAYQDRDEKPKMTVRPTTEFY